MSRTSFLLSFVVLSGTWAMPAFAQTDAPLVESPETHYYDFWPGTWVEVVDGRPDTSATRFVVRRSVNPAAFVEEWRQVYDGAAHHSIALRGWDQVTETWRFTWLSDNALFQWWNGEKVDGHWYIVKAFTINDRTFLSRQAWIPETNNQLLRVMERSFDDGQTWETRSHTRFQRIGD